MGPMAPKPIVELDEVSAVPLSIPLEFHFSRMHWLRRMPAISERYPIATKAHSGFARRQSSSAMRPHAISTL
jgi:hypothetical protein